MTAITSFKARIMKDFIDPQFECHKLRATTQEMGYDIQANFIQSELQDLTKRLFDKVIFPSIQTFLNSGEANQIYPDAANLDARRIFMPVVEERLKQVCHVIAGDCNAYARTAPTLWTWIASWLRSQN